LVKRAAYNNEPDRGDFVVLGNSRGQGGLHAGLFRGARRADRGIDLPNSAYADGCGINSLTGADSIAFVAPPPCTDKVRIRKTRAA
jgi:hypothetical protein